MSKMENIEKKLEQVNSLANEVAKKANDELSKAKHKITCLTILVGLFAILGANIAIYSMHVIRDIFENTEIETEVVECLQEVEQKTDGDGSNYFINGNDNSEVGA